MPSHLQVLNRKSPLSELFRGVPIPPRMQTLRRDIRGYPIPFIALRDKNDRPHFTINSERSVHHCLTHDVCGICGKAFSKFISPFGKANPEPHLAGKWFIGGPQSALHPKGAYTDPPVHPDCGEFALKVCPYLALPSYTKRIEGATLKPEDAPGIAVGMDPAVEPDKPTVFVAVWAEDTVRRGPYCFPQKTREMQFWRAGIRLTPEESLAEWKTWHKALTEGGI